MRPTDFRGFFNDETVGGDSLEVIAVWADHIYEVEHVRIGAPVPPALPHRLFARIVAEGIQQPTRLVDPVTRITYYVRRVHAAAPLADNWQNKDWQVPASLGLFVLIAFGLLTVGWMMNRVWPTAVAAPVDTELAMAGEPTPIRVGNPLPDSPVLAPDAFADADGDDATAVGTTPPPARNAGAWTVARTRPERVGSTRRLPTGRRVLRLDPIIRVEGRGDLVVTSTGPTFVHDALRRRSWLAACGTNGGAEIQIGFLLDAAGEPSFLQVDGAATSCFSDQLQAMTFPPVADGVLSVRHRLRVDRVGSP